MELTRKMFSQWHKERKSDYLQPAALSLLAYILPISPRPISPIVKLSSCPSVVGTVKLFLDAIAKRSLQELHPQQLDHLLLRTVPTNLQVVDKFWKLCCG